MSAVVQIPTGEEIVRGRKTLGMTQTQFAAALGVSLRSVAYWEKEKVQPTRAAVIGIWRLLESAGNSGPAQADIPPYGNGDVIRLVSPDEETTVVGRVHDDVWVGSDVGTRFTITSRTDQGWWLSVMSWARRDLPTRDGFYASPSGDVYTLRDGEWLLGRQVALPVLIERNGPLTKLVPVYKFDGRDHS